MLMPASVSVPGKVYLTKNAPRTIKMYVIWKNVLDLASIEVLNSCPLTSLHERARVRTISLTIIMKTKMPIEINSLVPNKSGSRWFNRKKQRKALEVRILSASGSRNWPQRVLNPYRRAYHPSYQSVRAAEVKTKKEIWTFVLESERKRIIKRGERRIRKTLSVLGKFK